MFKTLLVGSQFAFVPTGDTHINMGQFKKLQILEFQMGHQCLKSVTSVQNQKLLPIFGH